MAAAVCRALTRPKLIRGIEWRLYYLLLLSGCGVAFVSIWNPRRLFMIPALYVVYLVLRWAGNHDHQWSVVYPQSLADCKVWLAGGDPYADDPKPPERVVMRVPKVNV